MKEIIVVDIGGTYIRFAKVKNGKIRKVFSEKTPKIKEKFISKIISCARIISEGKKYKIGIACAGLIQNGKIVKSPNLPVKNLNLKSLFERRFKTKVKVENDARCAALAEIKYGKKKNFILISLGTGIGGGIVINGKLYKGRGNAGEFGHFFLDKKNDFEKLYQKAKGNEAKLAEVLGEGIAGLVSVMNPEVIVLTGGLRKDVSKNFLGKLKTKVKKYSFMKRNPSIKWSKLKEPSLLGAGLLWD